MSATYGVALTAEAVSGPSKREWHMRQIFKKILLVYPSPHRFGRLSCECIRGLWCITEWASFNQPKGCSWIPVCVFTCADGGVFWRWRFRNRRSIKDCNILSEAAYLPPVCSWGPSRRVGCGHARIKTMFDIFVLFCLEGGSESQWFTAVIPD